MTWNPSLGSGSDGSADNPLTAADLRASRHLIARVIDEIEPPLVQAALFGSKARGEARPGSDVDILLVFEWLPPDREPFAGQAEAIAEEVAAETEVPVTVWSVSLVDLEEGNRTPMLVDALEDARPLWCWPEPLPAVDFTPLDAERCTVALLERVAEGSEEFAGHLARGSSMEAATRARDDLVRLATAFLLLRGVTRPRRAFAIEALLAQRYPPDLSPNCLLALAWAKESFGHDGRDDSVPVPVPPTSPARLASAVEELRLIVSRELSARTGSL